MENSDLSKRVDSLEKRVLNLEQSDNNINDKLFNNWKELTKIIKDTIKEEMSVLIERIEKQDSNISSLSTRVCNLEGLEGKRALERQKENWKITKTALITSIVSAIAGFIIAGLLNNVTTHIINDIIENRNNIEVKEVSK